MIVTERGREREDCPSFLLQSERGRDRAGKSPIKSRRKSRKERIESGKEFQAAKRLPLSIERPCHFHGDLLRFSIKHTVLCFGLGFGTLVDNAKRDIRS